MKEDKIKIPECDREEFERATRFAESLGLKCVVNTKIGVTCGNCVFKNDVVYKGRKCTEHVFCMGHSIDWFYVEKEEA